MSTKLQATTEFKNQGLKKINYDYSRHRRYFDLFPQASF